MLKRLSRTTFLSLLGLLFFLHANAPAAGKSDTAQYAKLSINAREADLRDVVSLIAEAAGLNFVIDSDVKTKPISLLLINVEWPTALTAVLETHGLAAALRGNVLRIGYYENIISLPEYY